MFFYVKLLNGKSFKVYRKIGLSTEYHIKQLIDDMMKDSSVARVLVVVK